MNNQATVDSLDITDKRHVVRGARHGRPGSRLRSARACTSGPPTTSGTPNARLREWHGCAERLASGSTEPIKIGIIADLTGPSPHTERASRTRAAGDQGINAKGGIGGGRSPDRRGHRSDVSATSIRPASWSRATRSTGHGSDRSDANDAAYKTVVTDGGSSLLPRDVRGWEVQRAVTSRSGPSRPRIRPMIPVLQESTAKRDAFGADTCGPDAVSRSRSRSSRERRHGRRGAVSPAHRG